MRTSDGGKSWTDISLAQLVPYGGIAGQWVTCASATECFFPGGSSSGGVIAESTDAGVTWHRAALPPGTQSLDTVVCTSAADCIALGVGQTLTTSDGGITWTKQPASAALTTDFALACASTADCWVSTGSVQAGIAVTHDGGTHWTKEHVPGLKNQKSTVGGLACPSVKHCIAVSNGAEPARIVVTTNGGNSWHPVAVPHGEQIVVSVTCITNAHCVAIGEPDMLVTSSGGASWRTQSEPAGVAAHGFGGVIGGVSCPSATRCYAASYRAQPYRGIVLLTTKRWG